MLEAMTCGCYPVTTAANAQAIGAPTPDPSPFRGEGDSLSERSEMLAPEADTPESVAAFIKKYSEQTPIDGDEMYRIVQEHHSLDGLVKNMGTYIKAGN
jgi:hypothetical protein